MEYTCAGCATVPSLGWRGVVIVTPVQREILGLMAGGDDIQDYCYDYPYAICVGEHHHMPRRTLEALARNGWIEEHVQPHSATIYWGITEAGQLALAKQQPTSPVGGESE